MYSDTDSKHILYVRRGGTSRGTVDIGGTAFSSTSIESQRLLDSVEPGVTAESLVTEHDPVCLLLSDELDTADVTEIVELIGNVCPSLPIVAFATDDQTIDRVLDAGVSEVICCRAETAPSTLVDRRIASAQSVTEQEWAAAESEHSTPVIFEEIVETIAEVVWVRTAGEPGIDYINSAYETVWGRSPEPLYEDKSNLLETVHPADRQHVQEAMKQQFAGSEPPSVTYRIVREDGDIRWMRARSVHLERTEGKNRMVGIATDITDEKESEQHFAAEHDLVEEILQSSPVGIVVVDTSGQIVRANEQSYRIFDVPQNELEGGSYNPDLIEFYKPDGTPLADDEHPFCRVKQSCESVHDEQYLVATPESDETIISADAVPLTNDGSLDRVVITVEDITERVERERTLERQRDDLETLARTNRIIRTVDNALLGTETRSEVLQAVCDNLAATEPYHSSAAVELVAENRFQATEWTEQASNIVDTIFPITNSAGQQSPGYQAIETNQTQIVRNIESHPAVKDEWVDAWKSENISSFAAVPVSYDSVSYGVIIVHATDATAFNDRTVTVLDELGTTVGHALAAVESREREQTLTSLYRATEQFLSAETPQEVSEVIVETATDVLDLSGIGVFLLDEETSRLSPAAGTETLFDFFTQTEVFGPGNTDSIVWHSYITGEPQHFDDVRQSDRLANEDTDARSALTIPLGEHGVFVAAAEQIGVFDEQTRPLIRLLSKTGEAALDRVIGQADIRERDAELAVRAEEMTRLQERLALVRRIIHLIPEATGRDQLEQELCETLTDHDPVAFAWVGTVPPGGETPEPNAWAGAESGYLDTTARESGGPASQALHADETVMIPDTATRLHQEPWAHEALDRGYHSVLAVPLVYDRIQYGVAVVYFTESDIFDEQTEQIAEELGRAVAFGINNLETRHGVLEPATTEVRVSLGETNTFFNRVAETVGGPVSYKDVYSDDEKTRLQFALSDAPIHDILALESEFVVVESISHAEQDQQDTFQVSVTGRTIFSSLVGSGGVPRRVTATPNETEATVDISPEVRLSEFLDRLSNHHPGAELVPIQEHDQHGDPIQRIDHALDERLTERQREALTQSYKHGYFESPRETNGEEIAALLDVAQPTFTHHLREAQRRIFEAVFDEQLANLQDL